MVLTQQVPGRVLLQNRPDEGVPKTSAETLASCQVVDTVNDFAPHCVRHVAHINGDDVKVDYFQSRIYLWMRLLRCWFKVGSRGVHLGSTRLGEVIGIPLLHQ
jgi:hypothetical protein